MITPDHPRRKIAIVVFVFIVVIASGMSAFFYLGSQNQENQRTESITIGLMPSEVETLVYVALDQGYFKDNGLKVTLKNYSTGLVAVNGLLNNEVDIATAADFVVVGKAIANKSVTTISTIDKYTTAYLMVRTDLGVTNVSDLIGKKIGVPMGTVAEFNLGRFLELHGIGIDQVTLVNVPINLEPAAFINGSVSAIMTAQPYIDAINRDISSDKVLSWPAQSQSSTNYLAVTNASWAADHPDTIVRFLRALDRAEKYVIHDPEGAKLMLHEDLNTTGNYIERVWEDHQFSLSLEQSLILRMEDQSRWMIRNNLTANPVPNFLNYTYIDGLEAVNPESINIIR